MTYKIQPGYVLIETYGFKEDAEEIDLSYSNLLIGIIEASSKKDGDAFEAGNKIIYVAKGTFTIMLNNQYKKIVPIKNIISIKDENKYDY